MPRRKKSSKRPSSRTPRRPRQTRRRIARRSRPTFAARVRSALATVILMGLVFAGVGYLAQHDPSRRSQEGVAGSASVAASADVSSDRSTEPTPPARHTAKPSKPVAGASSASRSVHASKTPKTSNPFKVVHASNASVARPSSSSIVSNSSPTPQVSSQQIQAPGKTSGEWVTRFLQYGLIEDAKGDEALPDISWYEPARANNTITVTTVPTSNPEADNASHHNGRPKMVIIIDDISNAEQIRTLQALPFRITPSIFPPSDMAEQTPRLARKLRHFMVHLPLESGHRVLNRMRGMLFVRDTGQTIEKRIARIRQWFPGARYINNHTGSVFTADYRAMKRLYRALRRHHFRFVDSRTTSRTTVRRVVREYGDRYIARHVFIDNDQTVSAIMSQLKKAATYARKHGEVIVIGHPHPATFRALKRARKLLNGIQTVYIDELYD